MVDQQARFVFV